MTRFARPAGSLFAGSRFVQLAAPAVDPRSGLLIPPWWCNMRKKSPHFHASSSLNMAVRGGLTRFARPAGSLFATLSVCPTGCRQLSTPGRGFSSPRRRATCKKKPAFSCELFFKYGGEGGIRTPDTLPYTHFPGVLLQPLGHLTILSPPLLPGTGANLGKYVSLVNQLFQKTAYLDKLRATCFFNARQSFFLSPPAFYSIEK